MRGVRAGVAVAGAMIVCRMLGKPMGWAALGGFEAILVDNGGPYRSRLETMATLMTGGAIACIAGASVGNTLWAGIAVTAAFCFIATFARVASERIASTSVIILVLYFAGFGASTHTLAYGLQSALQFVLGGVWAAALSLILWRLDPFRPARLSVAECYRLLSDFTATMLEATTDQKELTRDGLDRERTSDFQRDMRLKMEAARKALGTTAARVTARTVRARNLTVLLETADMLFAITMRWRELAEIDSSPEAKAELQQIAAWLSGAEGAIWQGLQQRPSDRGASFLPEGSHSLEHVQAWAQRSRRATEGGSAVARLLAADERDALENIQIAFEAIRAIWTGHEIRSASTSGAAARWELFAQSAVSGDPEMKTKTWDHSAWIDSLRANWTFDSVMMRHALRMAVVGGVDILLLRLTHVRHGSWLGMTSIIVLQPYGSGTLRRGMQRVGGTIAGGVLAAVLATAIHNQSSLIAVITVVSVLTLATYAVNYAWYCFFLTPTFVLMSMPYLRDWQIAAVRMGNTVLGALVAVLAMRLLWPEKEHLQLGRLLGRGASADANYLTAVLRFWQAEPTGRVIAERQLLAPARRLSGLAINDAEESLDRLMLEAGFGRRVSPGDLHAEALTFVTYLRRLMRVATALTVIGSGRESMVDRVRSVAERLHAVSTALLGETSLEASARTRPTTAADDEGAGSVEEQQMRRMEKQAGVLERTAASLIEFLESSMPKPHP